MNLEHHRLFFQFKLSFFVNPSRYLSLVICQFFNFNYKFSSRTSNRLRKLPRKFVKFWLYFLKNTCYWKREWSALQFFLISLNLHFLKLFVSTFLSNVINFLFRCYLCNIKFWKPVKLNVCFFLSSGNLLR